MTNDNTTTAACKCANCTCQPCTCAARKDEGCAPSCGCRAK